MMLMVDRRKIPVTILICDPDENGRLVTQQAIEDARIINDLRFVEDGEQLLDYLLRRGAYAGETGAAPRPGLILLDLELPRLAGRYAIERIKGDPTLVDIPMAILTASRFDADVIDSYRLGGHWFITKPLTLSGLADAMNALNQFWFEIVESPPRRS